MCGETNDRLRLETQLAREVEGGSVGQWDGDGDGKTAKVDERVVEKMEQRPAAGPGAALLCRNRRFNMDAVKALIGHARDKPLATNDAKGSRPPLRLVALDPLPDPARDVTVSAIENAINY